MILLFQYFWEIFILLSFFLAIQWNSADSNQVNPNPTPLTWTIPKIYWTKLHCSAHKREQANQFFSETFPIVFSCQIIHWSIEAFPLTSCLSAALRKFSVCIKKSSSRFPSSYFLLNTSITSMRYFWVYTSYFQKRNVIVTVVLDWMISCTRTLLLECE